MLRLWAMLRLCNFFTQKLRVFQSLPLRRTANKAATAATAAANKAATAAVNEATTAFNLLTIDEHEPKNITGLVVLTNTGGRRRRKGKQRSSATGEKNVKPLHWG